MKTPALPFDDTKIPADLKVRPCWVNWKAKSNGERIDKIPMNPVTGGPASTTNADDWSDYVTVGIAASTHNDLGVGFVLDRGNAIAGIDLDHCRDPETGRIEPWADEIVQQLDSYTEISPSGTGLHIFVRG